MFTSLKVIPRVTKIKDLNISRLSLNLCFNQNNSNFAISTLSVNRRLAFTLGKARGFRTLVFLFMRHAQ